MNFWRSLTGMVEVCLTSADPSGAMGAMNKAGIEIFNACQEGDLSVRFTLRRSDFKRMGRLVRKRGETAELCRRSGLYWALWRLGGRPVLLTGMLLLLILTMYLPGQIYFIEVDGNVSIPTALIIEKAAECGIDFGADRREVRSEKMKNALLQAIPQLQWAGINTYGCRAVISVRERPQEEKSTNQGIVSSIVASRDGVIKEITAHSGNRLCQPGQAVKAGQVLISGYTDCGICIRATQAQGEVLAQTQRDLTLVLPLQYAQKGEIVGQEKKYSLLIGKKLINFSKDSGISTTGCDKMYSVEYMLLPGGLKLPLALVTETVVYYETDCITMEEQHARLLTEDYSCHYLSNTMIAGQILQKFEAFQMSETFCILQGRYACQEMIGVTRLEENLRDYGQTD